MFRSLRFRLPALFLVGAVLAGVVASLIALRLFQDYTRDQSVIELRREAEGLAQLYAESALRASDEGKAAPSFAAEKLELATGDRLFYVGTSIFPGQDSGLERLPESVIGASVTGEGKVVTFEFTPPREERTFLAVAQPLRLVPGTPPFGALVVAKPKTELRDRWLTLFERLAFASVGGILIAGLLALYLSRRITEPVLQLSRAADEIAAGRRDVTVPAVPGGGEIGHLSDRFREMAVQLAEAEELERNFLMTVSHELRTPLTAIRGHVASLRDGLVADPDDVAQTLDVVSAETDRLERLVGDVLDLAKLDAHRFTVLTEEVDMGRLVERAYSTFTEEARRRGIDYRQEVGSAPVIVSDGDRVLQIITNLLANAFRWTPDGGRIDLALAAANGAITVDVADSGPGIADDERERIFRPFWSNDGRGTGLGLPIARELAIALGGRIELETRVGAGSRFRLVLPAARDYAEASARRSSSR
ncbi:MAG: HAMP domain-containing histidine kinase [Actinobacteria bacterium]|nr:HAMP domain-containing histidine kinase [Actinomycetota bacterium]